MYHKQTSYDIWFLRYGTRRTKFFVILNHFLPFYTLNDPKNQHFEKLKKKPSDNVILQKCVKNHDHMLHCSWDTVHDRFNFYFSFWAIFCPFSPLATQEIKIKKKEKTPEDIIILQMCSKNYDHMMQGSWDMVHDRRRSRRTYRRTDGQTDRKSDI